MKERFFCLLILVVLILSVCGCGPARPAGMPQTAPCQITVLQNGQPMSGVDVSLMRADGNGALSITAYTNSSGVANIKTSWGNYIANGAPIGKCKITLTKHVSLPFDGVTDSQIEKFTPEEAEAYEKKREADIDKLRPIQKLFSNFETTPFEITIKEKTGGNLTIDVAKENIGK
ncbi:MAG: Ig-like domain-containing protein [Planctomycetaceae bacterium]|jgi:hypothetical protein|nr:Ig-like domain-containing protein [Planctomycetaceae bacterium]